MTGEHTASAQSRDRTPWTAPQRRALFAGVGSWTLDGLDYFILVFVLTDVANGLKSTVTTASLAITLTLLLRPIGAIVFGALAEKFGRKHILAINIVLYSVIELISALSPTMAFFLVTRIFYGVMMGGIWGVASALTMETVPDRSRGWVSGIFQAGYPAGYLIAAILYGLLGEAIGWRGLFALGGLPILLAGYMWIFVKESPVWLDRGASKDSKPRYLETFKQSWKVIVFAIVLMAAFNFFSHGTQDMYPTFLKEQHGFGNGVESLIAIFYNIAAILGGILAGTLSQKFGRRWVMIVMSLLVLPVIPLWAYSHTAVMLGLGAFIVQFMVQGAWGVIPAYLNELMPLGARAMLTGFVYQVGNVIASPNSTLQASWAEHLGGNFSLPMSVIAASVAVIIAVLVFFGKETRDTSIEGTA